MSSGKKNRQQSESRPSKFTAAADRMLESSLLKKLTFESASEGTAEDRRHTRSNVYARVQVTEIDGTGQEGRTWTASVLDASRGGIGLFSPFEAAEGEMLLVTFAPRTPDAHADTRLMRVCHCRRGGETGFVLGVRFEGRAEEAA